MPPIVLVYHIWYLFGWETLERGMHLASCIPELLLFCYLRLRFIKTYSWSPCFYCCASWKIYSAGTWKFWNSSEELCLDICESKILFRPPISFSPSSSCSCLCVNVCVNVGGSSPVMATRARSVCMDGVWPLLFILLLTGGNVMPRSVSVPDQDGTGCFHPVPLSSLVS